MDILKNKTVLFALLIVVLAWLIHNFLLESPVLPEEGSGPAIGADLIELSTELSQASFSTELFSKPAYRLLSDFSSPIPAQPVGRSNPFAVIGRD